MLLIGLNNRLCSDKLGKEDHLITSGTIVTVIREGTREDLTKYVRDARMAAMNAVAEQMRLGEDVSRYDISKQEYDVRMESIKTRLYIKKFAKLLLIEGDWL